MSGVEQGKPSPKFEGHDVSIKPQHVTPNVPETAHIVAVDYYYGSDGKLRPELVEKMEHISKGRN